MENPMRIMAAVLAVFALIYFLPVACHNDKTVNAGSRKGAYKSAMILKRYLPLEERVKFETAFFALDRIKSAESEDAFLDSVDGLAAEEVITLAKQEVEAQIAAGHEDFRQYRSWDDMLTQLTQKDAH